MYTKTYNSGCVQVKVYFPVAMGFLRTRMTESPRRNILEMYLSLLTGLDFFFPLPVFGVSVHISFTFSRTILQCLKLNKDYVNLCTNNNQVCQHIIIHQYLLYAIVEETFRIHL